MGYKIYMRILIVKYYVCTYNYNKRRLEKVLSQMLVKGIGRELCDGSYLVTVKAALSTAPFIVKFHVLLELCRMAQLNCSFYKLLPSHW